MRGIFVEKTLLLGLDLMEFVVNRAEVFDRVLKSNPRQTLSGFVVSIDCHCWNSGTPFRVIWRSSLLFAIKSPTSVAEYFVQNTDVVGKSIRRWRTELFCHVSSSDVLGLCSDIQPNVISRDSPRTTQVAIGALVRRSSLGERK